MGKLDLRSSVGEKATNCSSSIFGTYITMGAESTHKAYLNKDVLLHEMGHLMMYKQGLMPSGTGGAHGYGSACATNGAAYAEGWATFYSCAARSSAQMMDYFSSSSSNYGANLSNAQYYSGFWKSLPLKSTPAENQMFELNVGSVLWSYKNYSSYYNTQALTSPRKNSLEEIYDAAIAKATTSSAKETVWKMFNDRGCAFDTVAPTVNLSVTGKTVTASASDDVAVKRLVWLVNGVQVKVSDSDSDVLDLSDYPGVVTVEVRAYDLEGLENRAWPREQRYSSDTSTVYVYSSTATYAEDEGIILDKYLPEGIQQEYQEEKKVDIGNTERYSISTDGERDIYVYAHIIGGVNNINIYDPNGSLFDAVNYISPDSPYIIRHATAGTWTIEVVALSESDMYDILEVADLPTFSDKDVNADNDNQPDELYDDFDTKEDNMDMGSFFDNSVNDDILINDSLEKSFNLEAFFEDSDASEGTDVNSIDVASPDDFLNCNASEAEYIANEDVTVNEPEIVEDPTDTIVNEPEIVEDPTDTTVNEPEIVEDSTGTFEYEDDTTGESIDQIMENIIVIEEDTDEDDKTNEEEVLTYDEFAEMVKSEFSTKVAVVLSTKPSRVDCDKIVYTADALYLYDLLSTKSGVIVSEDGNNIDYTQALADGYYELELFRRLDGTTSDLSYMTLVIDTMAPEIEFENVFETNDDGIYLTGICSKDTAGAWIDGEELSLSEFTNEPILAVYLELAIGKTEMELTLIDHCGNTSTEKLVFTRSA